MKTLVKITACLLFMLLIFDCPGQVTYSVNDTVVLDAFPAKLRAHYFNSDGTVELQITRTAVYKRYDITFPVHRNQVAYPVTITDLALVNLQTGEKLPYTDEGDTLRVRYRDKDTVFIMNECNTLKRSGNDYLLYSGCGNNLTSLVRINYTGKILTMHILYRREPSKPVMNDEMQSLGNLFPNPLSCLKDAQTMLEEYLVSGN